MEAKGEVLKDSGKGNIEALRPAPLKRVDKIAFRKQAKTSDKANISLSSPMARSVSSDQGSSTARADSTKSHSKISQLLLKQPLTSRFGVLPRKNTFVITKSGNMIKSKSRSPARPLPTQARKKSPVAITRFERAQIVTL